MCLDRLICALTVLYVPTYSKGRASAAASRSAMSGAERRQPSAPRLSRTCALQGRRIRQLLARKRALSRKVNLRILKYTRWYTTLGRSQNRASSLLVVPHCPDGRERALEIGEPGPDCDFERELGACQHERGGSRRGRAPGISFMRGTWKREFKLPWREAGPPNHHDDKVDSDQ